jgi:hypothetical protein
MVGRDILVKNREADFRRRLIIFFLKKFSYVEIGRE